MWRNVDTLLDEETLDLEANQAANRMKAPSCMLVSASLLALETHSQEKLMYFSSFAFCVQDADCFYRARIMGYYFS